MKLIRLAQVSVCLGMLAASAVTVRAQSYVYMFGSNAWSAPVSVPGGSVDAANGNLHIEIPVASMPERGSVPFVARLVYDSHIWVPATSWMPNNVPNSSSGWRLVTTAGTGGGVTYRSQSLTCYQLEGHGIKIPYNYTEYSNFGFTTADGHYVPFSGYTIDNYEPAPCITSKDTYSGFSTDASGYHIDVTGDNFAVVHAPDGTQVYPNVEDTNGNYFSAPNSNGDVTDDVGRTPITTTVSGNTITYKVTNSQNSTYTVTVTTETIPVNTAFGQTGVTEYVSTAPSTNYLTVVESIALPTGTYSFTYDSGLTAGHYGTLTGMTLPTGGSTNYSYSVYSDTYANKNQWLASAGASLIGTMHFAPSIVQDCTHAYCVQNFAVTQADSSSQVYSFQFDNIGTVNASPWVTSAQFLETDGSTLLTQNTTYDFSNAPTVVPITRSSTWPIPSGSISQQSTMTWDTTLLGNILTQNDWNFYSGTPPATQYKATKYTYLTNSDNDMVNKKTNIAVYAGSSTTASSTTALNYDGTATASLVGATQHDDANFGTGYNARGNLTSVVANSLTTTSTYDMTGQVTSIKDSNNHTTLLSYVDNFFDDTTGGPTAHAGSTDTNAYLTKVTNPQGWIANVGYYFGSGKLAKSTDFNSATTTHDYLDVMDRPTQAKAPLGWSITSFTSANQIDSYTGIGDATPSTGCSSCRHDQVALDNLGRTSTQSLLSDPEGASTTTTSYDLSVGRAQSVTNPERSGGNPTDGSDTYTYDGLGRILTVTHNVAGGAVGVVHTYYGAKVTSTVGGITAQLCSTATYGIGYPNLVVDEAGMKRETWADGFGRTIEVDEPDNSNNLTTKTCYAYDVLNNLLTVVQGSQTRNFVYDSSSRLTAASTPESGTVNYYYTTSGGALCSGDPSAVCRRTDARSITTTYAYDALNRMTGITYSDTTHAVTYSYDSGTNQKGFRTGMTDGSGSTTWTYNLAGWLLTESRTIAGQVKTISYTYNQDGSLATLTYPSGRTITYTTSNAERTTSAKDVTNNIQYAVTASYAPVGALNSVIYGPATGFTGVTTTAEYNSLGEPTTISATSAGGTAQNLTYSFALPGGNNGSVNAIQNNTNSGLSEAFSYDNLNRVMSAKTTATSGAGCWGQSFGPTGPPAGPADDVYSNLTLIGVTNCAAGSLGIAVSATTNRITTTGYSFDAAGNMTQEAAPNGYGYTYDAEDHLTQATGTASGTWTYVYDGNGMRVEKSNGSGGTLYWRSSSGAAIAETDLNGVITNEYTFFDGQRIARRDASSNVYYYYSDQVGSTSTMTTASGTPCYEATFTPYGEEHNTVNTCQQNYKFTGYERDSETGLDYAFARYYNSRLGRFMSADLLAGDIGNPQSLNRYAYVLNNSTNLTDPYGLHCWTGAGCTAWNQAGWAGWGWGFEIVGTDSNINSGYEVAQTWTLTITTQIISLAGGSCDGSGCSETSYGPNVTTSTQTFGVEGDPFFSSGQALQVNGGVTTADFQKGYYKVYGKILNRCIGTIFGRKLTQTVTNAPNLDISQTRAALGAVGENQPFNGPHGTVLVANEAWNENINTTPSLIAEVYTHELGNILDERLNPNVPQSKFGRTYGNPHDTDTDTGRALSRCVFPTFKF